eukprot:Sspe_Gene.79025::Locus_49512_Transcript_1_1_Confidence_1.000_Length_2679::g.79025::m.79025
MGMPETPPKSRGIRVFLHTVCPHLEVVQREKVGYEVALQGGSAGCIVDSVADSLEGEMETTLEDFFGGYNTCWFTYGGQEGRQSALLLGSAGAICTMCEGARARLTELRDSKARRHIGIKLSLFQLDGEDRVCDLLSDDAEFTARSVWQDPLRGHVVQEITEAALEEFTPMMVQKLERASGEHHLMLQMTLYWTEAMPDGVLRHQISTMRVLLLAPITGGEDEKGLSILRRVVGGLAEAQGGDVAGLGRLRTLVKESTLTYLMCECLGGNCITTLIACVAGENLQVVDETLHFAAKVRMVSGTIKPNWREHSAVCAEIERLITQVEVKARASRKDGSEGALNDWSQNIVLRRNAIELLKRHAEAARRSGEGAPPSISSSLISGCPTADEIAGSRHNAIMAEMTRLRRENESLTERVEAAEMEVRRRDGVEKQLGELTKEIERLQSELEAAKAARFSSAPMTAAETPPPPPVDGNNKRLAELVESLNIEKSEKEALERELRMLRQREIDLQLEQTRRWQELTDEQNEVMKEFEDTKVAMKLELEARVKQANELRLEAEAELKALHQERKSLFRIIQEGKRQYDHLWRQLKRHGDWRPPGHHERTTRRGSARRDRPTQGASGTSSGSDGECDPATSQDGNGLGESKELLELLSHERLNLGKALPRRPRRKTSLWYRARVEDRLKQAEARKDSVAQRHAPPFKPRICHYDATAQPGHYVSQYDAVRVVAERPKTSRSPSPSRHPTLLPPAVVAAFLSRPGSHSQSSYTSTTSNTTPRTPRKRPAALDGKRDYTAPASNPHRSVTYSDAGGISISNTNRAIARKLLGPDPNADSPPPEESESRRPRSPGSPLSLPF